MIYHVVLFTLIIGVFIYIDYSISYEPFTQNKLVSKINTSSSDIFSKTIVSQNTDREKEVEIQKLLGYSNELQRSIKYIDGIDWKEWCNDVNRNVIRANEVMMKSICSKLQNTGYHVLEYRVRKFREEVNNSTRIMIYNDVILHKKASPKSFHVNIFSIHDFVSDEFDIVFIKLYGVINEQDLNKMNNFDTSDKMHYQQIASYHVTGDENIEDIVSEDQRTSDILYKKILEDDIDDEDYVKNLEHTKNQTIVRNMFMKKLQTSQPMTSAYKQYPYNEDFTISHI